MRDRAILLLGFAGDLRRSEIVSLDLKHVRFTPKGMTITLPYSITDQAGEGMSKTMMRSKGRLCPVRALVMWIEEAADVLRRYIRNDRKAQSDAISHVLGDDE